MKTVPATREMMQKTWGGGLRLGIPYQKRTAHFYLDGNERQTACGKELTLMIYQGILSTHRTPSIGDPVCGDCVKIVMG